MSGARWVEIPAHRVRVITGLELRAGDYEFLGEDGAGVREGALFTFVRRKSDGRLYRRAREFGAPFGVWVVAAGWDGVVVEEA